VSAASWGRELLSNHGTSRFINRLFTLGPGRRARKGEAMIIPGGGKYFSRAIVYIGWGHCRLCMTPMLRRKLATRVASRATDAIVGGSGA